MNWQPISTALKRKNIKAGMPILVWHDHDSDPYYLREGYLTPYGAWAEGNGYEATSGAYIAVWGGGYVETGDEYGTVICNMPDWWFKHDSEHEMPLAPTHWTMIPSPPIYSLGT